MGKSFRDFDDPQAYWNDDAGQRWVAHQEQLDAFMTPITRRLLEVAAPCVGERVIDVGCGCGDTTVQFAQKVGSSGHVLAVDVSAAMLARARERSLALAQVELIEADAGTHAFAPGAANLVTSRFGVMFFLDPIAAFSNLRRALAPGGRLCVAVWQIAQKNAWMTGPMRALPEMPAPEPAPEGAPGPFGLAESAFAGHVLEQAGFEQIHLDSFTAPLPVGETPEQAMRFYTQVGPMARYLGSLEPSERAQADDRVLRFLTANWGSEELPADGSCWFLQGVAP